MSDKLPNDSSLQSTRQMLDELDALMERMLAIPVNEMEDAPAFPKEVVPERALTATLTLLQTPAPIPTPAPLVEMPLHPPIQPPHRTVAEPEPAPEVTPTPLTNEVVPPSLLPKVEELLASVPNEEAPAAATWVHLPLLWINQAFDDCTLILGPSGTTLRSQAGRMLLGFVGVVLLLASATWFLKDWLGWQ